LLKRKTRYHFGVAGLRVAAKSTPTILKSVGVLEVNAWAGRMSLTNSIKKGTAV